MQGDMTEAMKTLDAGMAAAEMELRAASKALPVSGPASNPDGTSSTALPSLSSSLCDTKVSNATDAAIANTSSPVGDQQGSVTASTSSPVGHQQGTPKCPGLQPAGAEASSASSGADQVSTSATLHAAVTTPGTQAAADTSADLGASASNSTASQTMAASIASPPDTALAVEAPSTSSGPASVSSTPVNAKAAEQTVDHGRKSSSVVQVHVDASSSSIPPQTPAETLGASHGDSQMPLAATASCTTPAKPSQNMPTKPDALQQPFTAHVKPATPSSQSDASRQGPSTGASLEAPAGVQSTAAASGAGAVLPQQQQAAAQASVQMPGRQDPPALQPIVEGVQHETKGAAPPWQAEEGHFALMLQDFVVSALPEQAIMV